MKLTGLLDEIGAINRFRDPIYGYIQLLTGCYGTKFLTEYNFYKI